MDPTAPDPAHHPADDRRLSRFTSIKHTIRKTLIAITEPLSPLRSDFDLESGPPTPASETFRRWSTHRKSIDVASITSRPPRREPRTLMTIPQELQILVLGFLEFGDIERLRRTSKFWHNFATPRLVRSIYGPDTFRAMLIQHCRVCLTYCPRDVARLVTTRLDAGYPLSSRCVKCTVQSKDGTVRIGRKVTLGNFTEYFVCRWCGWPITSDTSTGHSQFHRHCYDKYAIVLLAFFFLGWVQCLIGVVASALVWHYFRSDKVILAPSIVGFIMMWACIVLIMFRGNRVRTYHLALIAEVIIIGLWIPPVYQIAKAVHVDMDFDAPRDPTVAIMVFIALNMLFRLLNILGNAILIFEYDRTRHYVPRIPIWRRFMNPILTALIFWTYPQHAERKFAPSWT